MVEETPSSDTGPSRVKRKSFDLDNRDAFWQRHKGAPFPEVAENIQTELNDYRSKADDIERMKQDMGLGGGGGKTLILAEVLKFTNLASIHCYLVGPVQITT